jgi:hypothetical protein
MLVTYDSFLTFPEASSAVLQKIAVLASEYGLTVDLTPTCLDFDYAGRDAGRDIVRFLKELAPLLADAEGEVECTVDANDDGNTVLEFYSIAGGKLYCELGRIVRSERKLVE